MEKVKVDLKGSFEDKSYDILIERGLLDSVGSILISLGFEDQCCVVTNELVNSLYGEKLKKSLEKKGLKVFFIELPDGEEFKNLEVAAKVLDFLVDNRLERNTPLIALGGGVIGDLTGFVSSIYLRGVPFIQIPTTLLSQVDSSVGGKTGVNHEHGKNLIGSFYQPKVVIIDPDVLKTLEDREIKAGLAEVIKYGVIWDKDFFNFLKENTANLLALDDKLIEAIKKSCMIKAQVVSMDEKETSVRAILNFGHTFGHAIETLTNYSQYKHGEALAIGMVMASLFSCHQNKCSKETSDEIKKIVETFGLKNIIKDLSVDDFYNAMMHDKKVSKGEIKFILALKIGEVQIEKVEKTKVIDFLKTYFT